VHTQAVLALAVHNIIQLVKAAGRKKKDAAQAQSLKQKVFLFLQHISLWLHPSTLQWN
jgi:ABC-type histidine transport system ATPase subunit